MKRALLAVMLLSCSRPAKVTEPPPLERLVGPLVVRVPARASGVMRIEREAGVHLDVVAIGARDVALDAHDPSHLRFAEAFEATDVVHVVDGPRIEETRRVARRAGDPSLHYRVVLGPALRLLRVVDRWVEALDERGVARLRAEPAFVVDAGGHRVDLHPHVERDGDAWRLDYPIEDGELTYPLDIDPAWTATTYLAKERRSHHAFFVSGSVYTLTGLASDGLTKTVEAYDPSTKSWTMAGNVNEGRMYYGSTLLSSGKIFLAGDFQTITARSTAEVFDPKTGTSTTLATMPWGMIYPSVHELADGSVLVVDRGAAIYSFTTSSWTSAPPTVTRAGPSGVKLADGRVLVVGGSDVSLASNLSSAEIYDPATKKWTAVAPMHAPRSAGEVVLLPSGKVLVAGGTANVGVNSSAEIYDPATNTWTKTPDMAIAHSYCGSALLPSGKVLMIAGDFAGGVTSTTEIYDPTANTWSLAGQLFAPRDDFAVTLLPTGRVLLNGGSLGAALPVAEIYDPLTSGKACLGPGECASGFCVDGFCCGTASCAANETCGGTGNAGGCAKKDGETCAGDAECGSAHCVDGVCCDSACSDVCGACDVKGSIGKCAPVAAGDAPHGTRAKCPGSAVCQARCGGIDVKSCTQFPSAVIACGEPSCADGVETRARGCDGAGSCEASTTHACAPYACGDKRCKTQCASDADCASGNTCDLVTRKCVIAATCEDAVVLASPDGNKKDCSPYRCNASQCGSSCASSEECAPGFVCESSTSHCVAAAPAPEDSGGCALGATPSRRGTDALAVLVVTLLALHRRRRISERTTAPRFT
ncbi:MAG: kelch repeat-containing protein [Polyangiales bacterium]